jgi:hypothetical protein
MKRLFTVLLMMLAVVMITRGQPFSGTSGDFTLDSKPPVMAVVSPNGGETLSYLDPFTTTWTAMDDTFELTPISIGISTEEGGAYTLVASNLPNTGTALVTPPGIATQYGKIWAVGVDGFGNIGLDASDGYVTFNQTFSGLSGLVTFDSKPPMVTVIKPNGGEAYYYADPLLVKWDASDESFGTEPVTVSVSTDGGTSYTVVAAGLPDADSAYVTAPEVITDLAKVKVYVQDEFGLTAYDESDAVFSLQGFFVDLKAFLEGPFAGAGMLSYLNFFGYIPLMQPYDAPPWNYAGTESVTAMPNNDVVDWVLIELRDAANASSATSATTLAKQAGFILEDGSITTLDGTNDLQFGVKINQNLFAVVWHRNHLGIMSANPVTAAGNQYSYDFTSGSGQVYGGSNGHKELASGIWGMVAGDGDADKQVSNADKLDVWKPQSGTSGYKAGDFDMNGQVDNADKIDRWKPNSGRSSQVPG